MIQPDVVKVEKEELLLTSTEYCTALPVVVEDAAHCSWMPHEPEQMPSGSARSTGIDGAVGVEVLPERVKLPTGDHADTLEMEDASRA